MILALEKGKRGGVSGPSHFWSLDVLKVVKYMYIMPTYIYMIIPLYALHHISLYRFIRYQNMYISLYTSIGMSEYASYKDKRLARYYLVPGGHHERLPCPEISRSTFTNTKSFNCG